MAEHRPTPPATLATVKDRLDMLAAALAYQAGEHDRRAGEAAQHHEDQAGDIQ